MSVAIDFWQSVERQLDAGHGVFLALVAENTAHSPGTAGAKMMLSESGVRVGTIGGGIMEKKLLERAAGCLSDEAFRPEIQTLHHQRTASGIRSGMICAGQQTNLYLVLQPDRDHEAIVHLGSLLRAGSSGLIQIDDSGLRVIAAEPDLPRPPIRLHDEPGWLYEEELLNRRRIAILGGGHCALALARAMRRLGYSVLVFETREGVFDDEMRDVACFEIVEDFRQAGGRVEYPELTWVVVMTTDFPSDVRALSGALGQPFRFLGVMGAPAKLEEIRRRLGEQGFGASELDQIHAPVGLSINSHTPEEIAVSVAAQILQLRMEDAR